MRVAVLMTGLTAYQATCFQAFARLGNELLLVHPPSMAYAPFAAAEFDDSVRTMAWDGNDEMPAPETLLPVVEEFAPDVVVMWSWSGKGYRSVMKDFRNRALRVIFTSNFWHGSLKQYVGLAVHRFYVDPLFDCAWVPGERSEAFARRLGFDGGSIIRGANSADVDLFRSDPRDGAELASHRRFLFSGRLIWHKAPTLLAEAYVGYRAQVQDPWDLDIVGDGPLKTDFEGIDGVTHRGFVQPEELAKLMHESSAFILPSHIEWYGVVVHEAAVAGLPLICSDGVGAVPHLLQDGYNGWTVPAGGRAALTEAMVRMSSVPPSRLEAMSRGSQALGSRLSPEIWALNLHEELERRLPIGRERG
ncbi:MAG TPA: glycosyltransferase [Nocardioides sp.]|nr:glycosyltransferase [Nocardioides sp.]